MVLATFLIGKCAEKKQHQVLNCEPKTNLGVSKDCVDHGRHNIIIIHRWNLHLHLLCLMTGTSYILGTRFQQIMRLNTIMIEFFFLAFFEILHVKRDSPVCGYTFLTSTLFVYCFMMLMINASDVFDI